MSSSGSPSSSSLIVSCPFPRVNGSAVTLSRGGGGLHIRHRLLPWTWTATTSCLSVCAGADMSRNGSVMYTLSQMGSCRASRSALHMTARGGM